MSEPVIEDWWEGNEPREAPVATLRFGRGLAEALYETWWRCRFPVLRKIYGGA